MIIDNPSPKHIPALRALWQQAFGDSDDFLDCFFKTAFSCERCRCVFSDRQPVAAVYLFDCSLQEEKLAYLYALAVEENHRSQGLSRLLLADTHAWLQHSGYSGAVMEPADPGLCAYYQRLGYRPFGGRDELTVTAGASPAQAIRLGELGYIQERDRLLPPKGIRQTGAWIALLHTQAEFYGGEDYVAAISRNEPYIYEFLGNREALPGLLRQLMLPQATVRLPGSTPTGVYFSFDRSQALPDYFGLPLD